MRTRGGTQFCYRLVVAKTEIPEVSQNWVGHKIKWTHTNDDGSISTESATIRDVVQRTDNPNHWNIDFDKTITHFDSDDDAKKYWSSFAIAGSSYNWKSKNQLFEEVKNYLGV